MERQALAGSGNQERQFNDGKYLVVYSIAKYAKYGMPIAQEASRPVKGIRMESSVPYAPLDAFLESSVKAMNGVASQMTVMLNGTKPRPAPCDSFPFAGARPRRSTPRRAATHRIARFRQRQQSCKATLPLPKVVRFFFLVLAALCKPQSVPPDEWRAMSAAVEEFDHR